LITIKNLIGEKEECNIKDLAVMVDKTGGRA